MKGRRTARKLFIFVVDVVTVLLLGAGVYLLMRPESVARQVWREHRVVAESEKAAARLWSTLLKQASHLHNDESPADIIEISSYDCVFCRRTSPSVDSALNAGVKIAYLHLPSLESSAATGAAMAALCAESQGR